MRQKNLDRQTAGQKVRKKQKIERKISKTCRITEALFNQPLPNDFAAPAFLNEDVYHS